jgi:hypothetical protein
VLHQGLGVAQIVEIGGRETCCHGRKKLAWTDSVGLRGAAGADASLDARTPSR